MRFGPGSELEAWLYKRHLFGIAVVFVITMSILFVVVVNYITAPTPACGVHAATKGECTLNVDTGRPLE